MLKGFSKYLDDPKFVDWIAHPTAEKDAYWERYISENPKEKQKIRILKECLSIFRTKDDVLSRDEKEEILGLIYQKVSSKQHKPRLIYLSVLKYAAVFVILVGLGLYMTTESTSKTAGEIDELLQVAVDSISTTKLVLSDAKEIHIEDKKSDVNYSTSANLVINQKDTITIANTIKDKKPEMNQLIVPFGKHSKLTLSDGSIVHLNSGSRLIFPAKFTNDIREVYLGGEAFFEVESDTERPFVVKLVKDETFSVEAVGTKFNVNSYDRHNSVTTVLTEGEVHLKDNSKNSFFSSSKKTIMRPGELAEWNVASQTVVAQKRVNTDYYTSWINGILMFNSETLNEITSRISAFYNVDIQLSGEVDGEFKLTGKLDLNESLETTLKNLAITASIAYEKTESNGILIFK
ncbi:MAG: FecR domain-containing protein [Bacteroidota bacterium]